MKILFVEDEPTTQIKIKNRIEKGGYSVDVASNATEGISKLEQEQYDLLLLDIQLPDINGLDLCEQIRKSSNDKYMDIPVIFFTGTDSMEYRERGFNLGAYDFFLKNRDEADLLLTIDNILSPKKKFDGFNILLVEDDTLSNKYLSETLKKTGANVSSVFDGNEAIEILEEAHDIIDIIVSDIFMPNIGGLELLIEVRQKYGLRHLPFIMISGKSEEKDILECLNHGATDYFSKPIIKEIFVKRIESYLLQSHIIKYYQGQYSNLKETLK